jgi:beta-lactamase class D
MNRLVLPFTLVTALALLAAACSPAPSTATVSAPARAERPDWGRFFEAEGGTGTFVLLHTGSGQISRHNPDRAATRYLPASTFKIYNSLVALETRTVSDPDSMFAWDGEVRRLDTWNRDNSLRSGMVYSTIWLFQRLAYEIGPAPYAAAFAREPYGNGTMGADVGMFWLDNTLRISADEQVAFLERLRRGALAFRPDVQATARDILPVLATGSAGRVRAKTGWGFLPPAPGVASFDWLTGSDAAAPIGWLVGWVEHDHGGAYVFALNVEPAREDFDMGPARLRIARAILESEGIWPE